jgi:Xaa-Pro dipeptidase
MRNGVALSEKHQGKDLRPLVNWSRLQQVMDAAQVDVLVATTPVNVTYLSDFWSLSHWSRISAQTFAIVGRTPGREVEIVLPLSNSDLISPAPENAPTRIAPYGAFTFSGPAGNGELLPEELTLLRLTAAGADNVYSTALDALLDAVRRASAGTVARIALEAGGLQPGDAERLAELLPQTRWNEAGPLLRDVRVVKTPREIDLLREAAVRTDEAIATAFAGVAEGDTELDVQAIYQTELASLHTLPFLTSITSGRRTVFPNGQAGSRVLENGDLVRFDGGGRYRLYAADLARMAVVGGASDKQRSYYGAVKEGLETAISHVKAGAFARDVFNSAVEATRAAGIAHYERSHCGHGIGIENYDTPYISSASSDVLEEGMVICLETPYYELGWGGIQVEDTLLVTANGAERFTTCPPELPVCRLAATPSKREST